VGRATAADGSSSGERAGWQTSTRLDWVLGYESDVHFPLATVLLDPPTALVVGGVIALASPALILRDPSLHLLRTALLGGAWGVFYGLCVGYEFFVYPDWMLAYLKDAREVALVPTFLAFLVALGVNGAAGAAVVGTLLWRRKTALAWGFTVAATLALGLIFYLHWPTYTRVGTYAEYLAGAAEPLPQSKLQTAMTFSSIPSTLVGLALVGWQLWKGRQAARTPP
jgi:hypothetical protein